MSIWIYVETYSDSISCGLNNAINPPFGNGLYIYISPIYGDLGDCLSLFYPYYMYVYTYIYIYYHVIHR